jgi:hypothetical protein
LHQTLARRELERPDISVTRELLDLEAIHDTLQALASRRKGQSNNTIAPLHTYQRFIEKNSRSICSAM